MAEPVEIKWIKAKLIQRSSKTQSVRYGYECSNCKAFEMTESRYCRDCGGIYKGFLKYERLKEAKQ